MKQSLILISLLASIVANAQAQTFSSGNNQTQLVELFSSQGCSSCPPAERWISKQINNPDLWHKFIPVVYHVDYWDYLGWKDSFSSPLFSKRQRAYHNQGMINSVYTPGMLLNGKEWRDWYRVKTLPSLNKSAESLSAVLINNNLKVTYNKPTQLRLHIALLGFAIKTDVGSGENSGRSFTEDFIVLNLKTLQSNNGKWDTTVNLDSQFNSNRYALVIWVTPANSLQPLQATGGWIN